MKSNSLYQHELNQMMIVGDDSRNKVRKIYKDESEDEQKIWIQNRVPKSSDKIYLDDRLCEFSFGLIKNKKIFFRKNHQIIKKQEDQKNDELLVCFSRKENEFFHDELKSFVETKNNRFVNKWNCCRRKTVNRRIGKRLGKPSLNLMSQNTPKGWMMCFKLVYQECRWNIKIGRDHHQIIHLIKLFYDELTVFRCKFNEESIVNQETISSEINLFLEHQSKIKSRKNFFHRRILFQIFNDPNQQFFLYQVWKKNYLRRVVIHEALLQSNVSSHESDLVSFLSTAEGSLRNLVDFKKCSEKIWGWKENSVFQKKYSKKISAFSSEDEENRLSKIQSNKQKSLIESKLNSKYSIQMIHCLLKTKNLTCMDHPSFFDEEPFYKRGSHDELR
jgi:hypothetical protein